MRDIDLRFVVCYAIALLKLVKAKTRITSAPKCFLENYLGTFFYRIHESMQAVAIEYVDKELTWIMRTTPVSSQPFYIEVN